MTQQHDWIAAERMLKQLVKAGMERRGAYGLDGGKISLVQSGPIPETPGLYAMVPHDFPLGYLGMGVWSVFRRAISYASKDQRRRVNQELYKRVSAGRPVELWVWPVPDEEFHGVPVSMAAGIETGLLKQFTPPWKNSSRLPGTSRAANAQ